MASQDARSQIVDVGLQLQGEREEFDDEFDPMAILQRLQERDDSDDDEGDEDEEDDAAGDGDDSDDPDYDQTDYERERQQLEEEDDDDLDQECSSEDAAPSTSALGKRKATPDNASSEGDSDCDPSDADMDRSSAPAGHLPSTSYERLAAQKRIQRAQSKAEKEHEDEVRKSAELIDKLLGVAPRRERTAGVLKGLRGRGTGLRRARGSRRPFRVRKPPVKGPSDAVIQKLGEANLMYAASDFDQATLLLKEVIRMNPDLPDPYHTMALVHEAKGEHKKAFDFSMLAAHLTPKDSEIWKRLAAQLHTRGQLAQTAYCLTRVLRITPDDTQVRWDRAMLYLKMEDHRGAARSFEDLLPYMPKNIEVHKHLARCLHEIQQYERAAQVMQEVLEHHPEICDFSVVTISVDLLMVTGKYQECLSCMDNVREQDWYVKHIRERGMPVDLNAKLAMSLMHLGRKTEAEKLLDHMRRVGVLQCPESYLMVADEYWALGNADVAHQYYKELQSHPDYDKPRIWAQLAACKCIGSQHDEAVKVYDEVLQAHPAHHEAMVAKAELLCELDRKQEALETLSRIEPPPVEQAGLWLRLGHVFYVLGDHARFLDFSLAPMQASLEAERRALVLAEVDETLARPLPRRHHKRRRRAAHAAASPADVENAIFVGTQPRSRSTGKRRKRTGKRDAEAEAEAEAAAEAAEAARQKLESQQSVKGESQEGASYSQLHESWGERPDGTASTTPLLPDLLRDEDQFQMLLTVLRILVAHERYVEAERLMQTALSINQGMENSHRIQLKALAADIQAQKSDYVVACESIRVACSKDPCNASLWNVFGHITSCTGGLNRHHKFILRMKAIQPESIPLAMLLGHYHAMNGNWMAAVAEYRHVFRDDLKDPLVSLCIGLAFLHHAMTRKVASRDKAILQAFAFLDQYSSLRKCPQEQAYNFGRACHQLGLNYLAVYYYHNALNAPMKFEPTWPENTHQQQEMCNLRCEAAHNLSLIYRDSDAPNLARSVLRWHAAV